MADPAPFILASASPRRLDLLAQIGVRPARVVAADVDETPKPRELPAEAASRLAEAKARHAHDGNPGMAVLAADTVVAVGRRHLGKAKDGLEAARFLSLLSGRRHRVVTGVALITAEGRLFTRRVMTVVRFRRLADADIRAYVATGEWRDKAGAYAVQGRAAAFIDGINGSYSNVVGLPLAEVAGLLKGAGVVDAATTWQAD